MDETEINAAPFGGVVFTIIPSDDLEGQQGLREVLQEDGGRFQALSETDQRIERLEELTHIITTHIDFPQYNAALEHGIHVVKPSWVITSANKKKQAQPRQHSPDPSQFMKDVVLTCADLPEGDKDAIIAGVFALGGQYSAVLSKLVTHIVTNEMDNEKCRLAQEKLRAGQLKCKIVLPHWFDDCFRLGRMINERPYTFPDPELLRADSTVKVRENPSSHLNGAIVATPTGELPSTPPPSPSHVRKNLNALMTRKVMLSKDLELSKHLSETLKGLINHAGATMTTNVEDCDTYIGQYRDGEDYVKVSREGKTVANLSWLYHVLNINKYSNPLSKLLHYPLPRKGIPGFDSMRISISNYSGDARIYLENLIKYSGAEFTKTMKQDNTHLITAHRHSEKCEAAEEWGIHIINHLWLEESFAKCAVQTLTNPRYTHFPARTNLGEVTGQTSLDMKKIERVFFLKPSESPQKPTQQKQSPKKTVALTLAPRVSNTANEDAEYSVAAPMDDAEDDQPSTNKKARGRPRGSIATPRFRDDEKENESPLQRSSGRAAAAKAQSRMHNLADDIALFQKEMKRKGGVTHGGRRSDATDDIDSPAASRQRKKRTSDEASFEDSKDISELSDGETQQPAKRSKNAPASTALPPVEYKLMVSGDERWLGNGTQETRDKRRIRQLGVEVVIEPHDVDILVAPKILRTRKFVCALASAPMVVDTTYLDHVLKRNNLPDVPPLLEDPEGENRLDLNLAESLERARINKGKLFRGWEIFVTREVKGGYETYKDIIQVNGGKALAYAGRTGLQMTKRRQPEEDSDAGPEAEHQGDEDEVDYVYLVSGTTDPEAKLWKQFTSTAEKQGLKARIVETDWLINAAMRQEVVWKDDFLLNRGKK